MKILTSLVLAAMLALTAAPTAQAGEALSASAIKKLFPGRFAAVVRGYSVTFIAGGGGRLVGKYMSLKDTGRWYVRSGRLCIMLKSWLDGRYSCSRVVEANGWYKANEVRFRKL